MTGKTANPQEKIRRTVQDYKDQISSAQQALEEMHSKGLISDENYRLRFGDFTSLNEYADGTLYDDLLKRYKVEDEKRAAQITKRAERLRTQGRRLNRNRYGSRGND